MPFNIVSDFVPTGDQPTAIKQLVEGLKMETKVKLYLVLLARAKHLPLPMLSSRFKNLLLLLVITKH